MGREDGRSPRNIFQVKRTDRLPETSDHMENKTLFSGIFPILLGSLERNDDSKPINQTK